MTWLVNELPEAQSNHDHSNNSEEKNQSNDDHGSFAVPLRLNILGVNDFGVWIWSINNDGLSLNDIWVLLYNCHDAFNIGNSIFLYNPSIWIELIGSVLVVLRVGWRSNGNWGVCFGLDLDFGLGFISEYWGSEVNRSRCHHIVLQDSKKNEF